VSAALPNEDLEWLFKSWLIEHHGAVLKVARAYTFTTEDCQDLVQEILLQVWRSLPQFQGRARASTWFYRVALNTALSWHRKEHRRRTRQRPVLEVEDLLVPGLDSAQQMVQREAVERLYAAIRQLPKTDAAMVLLYLDDLSYRQMAEVLGITESNVGVKLNRAKKALGELMKEESNES
jgi:RNA polymerase sigma-70 factor, ECF subfamily